MFSALQKLSTKCRKEEHLCEKEKEWSCAQWASKKGAEIVFSPPKLCSSSDRFASLCHISLRRSSQLLAGCVWPGLATEGASVRGQTFRPAACSPSRGAHTSLGSHRESGSHWGVGLSAPLLHPSKLLGRSVGGWMTLTGSNCQLASECIGKERWHRPRGEGRRSRRGVGEWRWMTKGLGVSYPGRGLSSSFMVWSSSCCSYSPQVCSQLCCSKLGKDKETEKIMDVSCVRDEKQK